MRCAMARPSPEPATSKAVAQASAYPALPLGGGELPSVFWVGGTWHIQLAQILGPQALQRGQLRAGQGWLAGHHRKHLRLSPRVQHHQPQGRGAHGQRGDRGEQQNQQHHSAGEHMEALRQRAAHLLGQSPPTTHAPQQQHQRRCAQHRHGQRRARCQPAPGVVQQPRSVQVLHPTRQRRGLPRAQHPAIGRVHISRLRLLASKTEHHDRTRGQVPNFFGVRHGACHALDQGGHRQVARRCGRLPSLLHRIDRQHGAADAQHHSQSAKAQAQPAMHRFPAHARPIMAAGSSRTGCRACQSAACLHSPLSRGCGPLMGCRACLRRRRRCGCHSPHRSVRRPSRR